MALQIEIMPVTAFRQNCCLIWNEESGKGVLTDAGGDADFLLRRAQELGIQIEAVWLTHGHLDHAAGVPDLRTAARLPVLGPHREDGFLLENLPAITAEYGFPLCPAFLPDRWLEEGDTLEADGFRFDVLHIPGHTPGHLVFHCAAEKLLIAGDVLFYESIGRTDFPRGNHEDLIEGIREKLFVLPEDTVVIPGHGRTTTIGHEKRCNPFFR
ncbi:MAG: MBL fold metallo-hydrolase [Neisseria sp.]|nr:MBL fold metallo-hydrolase [Neisseria sp.]